MEISTEDLPTTFDPDALVAANMNQVLNGFDTTPENRLDVSAGGLLTGPGTDTGDEINTIAPAGTFILNAAAVRVVGLERLGELVSLAQRIKHYLMLSPEEYVVPPSAVAALGRKFWFELNDSGLGVDPERAVRKVSYAIQFLQELVESGGDEERLSPEVLAAVVAGNQIGCPSSTIDSRETGVLESRLGRGGLGIALGAAADEFNRQQQNRRLDRADRRAEEDQSMQRQSNAQMIALYGLGLDEARQKQQEQTAVREHLKVWSEGRKRLAAGDFEPFMNEVNQYNTDQGAFKDGYQLVPQNTPDRGLVLNHVAPDGTVKAAYGQQDALKLYDAGMTKKLEYMSPKYFEQARKASAEHAEKEAERRTRLEVADKYSASRMYGADVRADTAEEVANIRGGYTTKAAEIRASAPRAAAGPKGLTLAQERGDAEIDAARDAVAGLSDEDIRVRTSPTTATGRENPQFDPQLSRNAKLANRRKIGPDNLFDERHARRQDPLLASGATDMADVTSHAQLQSAVGKQTPIAAARAAMATDPAMKDFSLGKQTGRGFEVLDKGGKLIGYYGRQ